MGEGTTRNQPCWCNSGKKYKNCHLGRESQSPPLPWETSKQIKRAFTVEKCSAPTSLGGDCDSKIVKAHTVPKSGSLAKIARNGHVYSFTSGTKRLAQNAGRLLPELTGINKASTFTGFCALHDDAIFAPVEKRPFTGTDEQCLLLGYRAVSREAYTKEASAGLSHILRDADKGKPLDSQVAIQQFIDLFGKGVVAGITHVRQLKGLYDQALVSKDYSSSRAYVFETEAPPPVMCSGAWYPTEDFGGLPLQNVADLTWRPAAITCTSYWGGTKGAIVLQWMAEDDALVRKFLASLLATGLGLEAALVRMMFEQLENLHMKPEWWEALPHKTRNSLVDRMTRSANPFIGSPVAALVDDGIAFDPWQITRHYSVGF